MQRAELNELTDNITIPTVGELPPFPDNEEKDFKIDEENPKPTEYKKILVLTNIPPKTFNLQELIEKLEPICTFTKGKEKLYRNSIELKQILRQAVPTLDQFYIEKEKEGLQIDMATSVKVVL